MRSIIVTASLFLLSLALSGCSGNISFPDTQISAPTGTLSLGTLQGSDYGGHAPLVGARVFVLEANPTATGYGQLAKSLLTSTSANPSFPTAMDTTSGSPTYGMYYVTTNNFGQFYLSGDYTCDIGSPVYLYAFGGNPQAPYANTPGTPNTYLTVTGATISGTGPYTVVFQDSSLVYQGETVTFTGSGSNLARYFNGTTQTVNGDSNLTATSFSVTVNSLTNNGVTLTTGSQTVGTLTATQASAPSNQAVVNLAMAGVCGDTSPTNPTVTSTANFSALTFVYVNEVSTVATAEAMAAFFKTPTYNVNITPGSYTNNGVTITPGVVSNLGTITVTDSATGKTYPVTGAYVGSAGTGILTLSSTAPLTNLSGIYFTGSGSSFATYINGLGGIGSTYTTSDALHISVPSSHPSAILGLQSAARNAAILYDIQGSNQTNNMGNGDAHVARTVTPANANGIVPQALLNTLGNILANCVDSANTYGVNNTGGTLSSQCSKLFNNATYDGTTSGLKPYDTATAAINIAHHPAGEPSGNTTFVQNLYTAPTGNVPFQPVLSSQPNDFSVGVVYSGVGLTSPQGVAIDAANNPWISVGGGIMKFSPQGAPLAGTLGYGVNTLANAAPIFDLSGNLWFINNGQVVTVMNSSGTVISGAGYDVQGYYPTAIAIDRNNNAWVANSQPFTVINPKPGGTSVTMITQAGVQTNFDLNPTHASPCPSPACLNNPWGIVLDASGLIWLDGNNSGNLASINPSNNAINWYNPSSTGAYAPRNLAIDQNNKIWMPNYSNSSGGAGTAINSIVPSAAVASGTANVYNVPFTAYTGGGLNQSNHIAVDGANNLWIMGQNNYVSEFTNAGVPLTPATGYAGGFPSGSTTGVGFSAVDLSGNLWIAAPSGNGPNFGSLIQMIGVATPVLTPMINAVSAGTPAVLP